MLVVLDGAMITGKEELHARIKELCRLPEYYGGTLDALYDVLTDREEALELHLVNAGKITEVLGDYGTAFFETLADAQAEGAGFTFRKD